MDRIFWGKCVTKREGGAAGEEKNIVICTGKRKRQCWEGHQFFVNMTAVIPNLSSLRHATGNIALSLLPQRADSADADCLKLLFH